MIDRDFARKKLLTYTKRAYDLLPSVDKPYILDIGCGSGVPTIQLARLTKGKIVAIDQDQDALHKLKEKIKAEELSGQIEVLHCDMADLPFQKESFDIIWSEGSISGIGFNAGLKYWNQFIKAGGYLVVHDELGNLDQKIKQVYANGYRLIAHFILNESVWWDEYFSHLDTKLKSAYHDVGLPLKGIALEVFKEIELHHKDPTAMQSVYFTLEKQ